MGELDSMGKTGKERLVWLDLCKGIAMALVLLGHSMRDEMRAGSAALDLCYKCAYIFHMSWFFWLSGYTYKLSRSSGTPPLSAQKKRLKKQLPVWLGYTALIWIAFRLGLMIPGVGRVLGFAGYTALPPWTYLLMALQANNPWAYHLWFLYVLMLITTLIALCDAAAGGKRLKAVCCVLIAVSTAGLAVRDLLVLGDWWRLYDYMTLYIPMVCLGILMADLKPPMTVCWIWGGAGAAYILIRALFFSGTSGNSVKTDQPAVRFFIYILAELLLPGLVLLLRRLTEEEVLIRSAAGRRFFGFLGRESLLIYILHQPFCCAFLGIILMNVLHLPSLVVMAVCILASILAGYIGALLRDRLRKTENYSETEANPGERVDG